MSDDVRAKWDAVAERMVDDPGAWQDAMPVEWWKRAARETEDALARQVRITLKLDQIIAGYHRLLTAGTALTLANRRRAAQAAKLHAEWQALRDQGLSAPQVANRPEYQGTTATTVYRKTRAHKKP